MLEFRKDPIGFGTQVLSLKPEHIWHKMVELAEGIRDHQFVAVRAGHSVSKTFSLGRIVVPWFKTCFQPSTVVTTAPSDNQIRNQLWREIHAAYSSAKVPLGGKMNTLLWDVRPCDEVLAKIRPEDRELWEKNFAIGFTTRPDTSAEHTTKMQGWHNEWVLVVIDEACGILPQIWRTIMESLAIDEQCKVVASGNPTDPECEFAKACHSSDPAKNESNEPYMSDAGWYVITISGMDTPNYQQNARVIPGLASRQYVERIIAKYGADGDGTRYRVKGLFPTFKEGTYYGRLLASARKEGRVGKYPHETTAKVYTFSDFGDMYTATIFAQFIKGRIRIIDDYWDSEGQGLPAWAKALSCKNYIYGGHFGGPDFNTSNNRSFQTGRTTKDVAANLGFNIEPVVAHSFDDGIEAVRGIFPILEVNDACSTFLMAAGGYGKTKNQALSTEDQVVYHDDPAKTWHRHMADAVRHLAMRYRYGEIGGEVLGFAAPAGHYEPEESQDCYEPMSFGRL